jgi:hypothetical protein
MFGIIFGRAKPEEPGHTAVLTGLDRKVGAIRECLVRLTDMRGARGYAEAALKLLNNSLETRTDEQGVRRTAVSNCLLSLLISLRSENKAKAVQGVEELNSLVAALKASYQ